MRVREYLQFLSDEARSGEQAATALASVGVADRDALLRNHPDWRRFGTMRALLRKAHEALDADPLVTLELAALVLANVDKLLLPERPTFLRQLLAALARKERANALFMQGHLEDALEVALHAAELFANQPVLVVERGSALVLVALVLRGLKRFEDAEAALNEAIKIFAEHGEARRYLDAIQTQAMIAADRDAWPRARELYLRAFAEADRLDDEREKARIIENIGAISLEMGDLQTANECLARALVEMTRLRLTSEIQRIAWNVACLERERGNVDVALTALCGVYPKLLERGLVADAMAVLVDIHDVVVEITGDVAYAKSLCSKLTITMGRYDVPANIREAIAYLQKSIAGRPPLAAVKRVLATVRRFLHEVLASSSSPVSFTAPALPDVDR